MYYEMIGFTGEPHSDPCVPGMPDVDLGTSSVFLDFDGTLVDLADSPDAIVVPEDMAMTLETVARKCNGRLVIVTGRSLASVEPYLGGFAGPIIGGHGAEERIDGVTSRCIAVDDHVVARMGDMAEAFAATHPGLLAERKPSGIVIHFRSAEDLAADAYAFLRVLDETHPGFELHHAKMAYELRPKGIGKELSIQRHMEAAPFAGTLPIFFGDDVTDEPALQWVGESGGLAVKVGEGDTAASNRVEDPRTVRNLLRSWAKA